jgi:FMN-dependent NADH-azoreductase
MKTLLKITTSLFSDAGQSSRLADRFIAAWQERHPGGRIIARDLARRAVPHLDAERFGAFIAPAAARTAAQQALVDFSDELIAELERADVIALGLPMYNFGLPSTLKAYFDHVARAGRTFRYTASGSEGLLKGKQAYVFAARGGFYAGTPADTQTAYVRDFLRFIGIEEVQFVYAEGLAVNEESKQAGLEKARQSIAALYGRERLAA